ncbi:MAG: hypothetical protein ACR2NN_29395 [Bryobacteraceae bacterium]
MRRGRAGYLARQAAQVARQIGGGLVAHGAVGVGQSRDDLPQLGGVSIQILGLYLLWMILR